MAEIGRQVVVVLYVVAMIAIIVGVDFEFFRNRFWERLAVNWHCLGVRSFLLEIPPSNIIVTIVTTMSRQNNGATEFSSIREHERHIGQSATLAVTNFMDCCGEATCSADMIAPPRRSS